MFVKMFSLSTVVIYFEKSHCVFQDNWDDDKEEGDEEPKPTGYLQTSENFCIFYTNSSQKESKIVFSLKK